MRTLLALLALTLAGAAPASAFDMEACKQRLWNKSLCDAAAKIEGRGDLALCVGGILSKDCVSGTGNQFTAPTALGRAVDDAGTSLSRAVQSVKNAMTRATSDPICVKGADIHLAKQKDAYEKSFERAVPDLVRVSADSDGMTLARSQLFIWSIDGDRFKHISDTFPAYDLKLPAGSCYAVTAVNADDKPSCYIDGCHTRTDLHFTAFDDNNAKYDVVVTLVRKATFK